MHAAFFPTQLNDNEELKFSTLTIALFKAFLTCLILS